MRILNLHPAPSWRRLGQAIPTIDPAARNVKDIPNAVSQGEWEGMPWERDSAIASLKIANLLWAIREKVAYSAYALRQFLSDPRTLAAINTNPRRDDFVDAANSLIALGEQLSLPNFMSSVRNLINALEINILPKKFAVEVRGIMPFLRPDNTLDCVRTGSQGPIQTGMTEILDFGDLCSSSIASDVDQLETAVQNPGTRLSSVIVFMDQFGSWLTGGLKKAKLVDYPPTSKIADEINVVLDDSVFGRVLQTIQTTDVAKAKLFIDSVGQVKRIWAQATSMLKWAAIGGGILLVGGLLSVVSGMWTAKPAPANPAQGA